MISPISAFRLRKAGSLVLTLALGVGATAIQSGLRAADGPTITLQGHRPPIVSLSRAVARVAPEENVHLAVTLPIYNQAELTDTIQRLYTPGDPLYGQYLTPETFAARFGPSEADYAAVSAYARSNGLTIAGSHANRLVLDVSGPAAAIEKAFGTRLMQYQSPEGRVFRAPESEPKVPTAIARRIESVVGLDTAGQWHPHNRQRATVPQGPQALGVNPRVGGSGPGGGLSPKDIKTAYNLNGVTGTGSGQVLGLFELSGYKASDILAYEQQFSLPNVTLQNVLVDGFDGVAGNGSEEVTLDIELMIAMAPGASKIVVYEGPNSSAGVIDTYNRIATDNLAKQISTSWGLDETSTGASTRNAENAIFQQMAAQGQSIYSASGDAGAYDNGSSLSVDDPSSQPYMTAVGGTTLRFGTGGVYQSETTWNGGSASLGAGGGGVSKYWPIPSYQAYWISTASKGSPSFRNVPDVALNADPNTGYSIFVNGAWVVFGGTSCAAPLWAGFTALVNEQRAANNSSLLGFANPLLYGAGKNARYRADFHDIADNSTNLYYPAVPGNDDATGWGSFNGAGLLTDLVSTSAGGGGGGGTGPAQLLGNPGFENGTNPAPWVATAGVVTNQAGEAPHGGSWKAWLDGYGRAHTDTLAQTVAIPANISQATYSFWMHVDTAEIGTVANDTLAVQIRNSSGAVLTTLRIYSNLNAAPGYVQKSFDLLAYKGQTIQIYFAGTENSSRQTSFVLDDFALTVL